MYDLFVMTEPSTEEGAARSTEWIKEKRERANLLLMIVSAAEQAAAQLAREDRTWEMIRGQSQKLREEMEQQRNAPPQTRFGKKLIPVLSVNMTAINAKLSKFGSRLRGMTKGDGR